MWDIMRIKINNIRPNARSSKVNKMPLNIIDLQTELNYAFFGELTGSKERGWGSWRVFWYGAHSSALSAVVAGLPGVKLTLSVDETKNLSKLIARASLFADHIAIRHQSSIPSGSDGLMGDVPLDFAGYDVPQGTDLKSNLNLDPDSAAGKLVFNRTVSLVDTWAKIQKSPRTG